MFLFKKKKAKREERFVCPVCLEEVTPSGDSFIGVDCDHQQNGPVITRWEDKWYCKNCYPLKNNRSFSRKKIESHIQAHFNAHQIRIEKIKKIKKELEQDLKLNISPSGKKIIEEAIIQLLQKLDERNTLPL
jgi:hypothetical protein